MAQRYYLEGFRPPYGIQNAAGVKALQRELGVAADGIWGPKTEAAYREKNSVTNSILQIPVAKDSRDPVRIHYNEGQTHTQNIVEIPGLRIANEQFPKGKESSGHSQISDTLAPGKATVKPDARKELQQLIKTSSFLDDKEKWRANYTIDALDQDTLSGLLKDVKRDGATPYFSRESWETRAMLMAGPKNLSVEQDTTNDGASFVKTSYGNDQQEKALPSEGVLKEYFTEEEVKSRTQKENAVMEAFRSLYTELKNNGGTEEYLGKILYHMMTYGDMANARKSGVFYQVVPYSDPEAYYCSPWEERWVTGRVIAEYLDFGKFENEYSRSQNANKWLEIGSLLASPFLDSAVGLIQAATGLAWAPNDSTYFYRSNPEMILKNGDVQITFQPDSAEYFEIYYFRDGEFLFSKIIDLPNSYIDRYGANFEEYASTLPNWSSPSDIPKIIIEYLAGSKIGKIFNGIK